MIVWTVVAMALQLQTPADPAYENERVRALVTDLATHNRSVPLALAGYAAGVRSEVAMLRVDAAGVERLLSVEQVAMRVDWTRDGRYREHAVGRRGESRSLLRFDALAVPSFTIPVLYGNRLDLLLGPFSGEDAPTPAARRETLAELHPLAEDRARVYAFTGGETSQQWVIDGRSVTIGRIGVEVRAVPEERTTVFEGDLYFDVERRQLVAMRGEIREIGGNLAIGARIRQAAITTTGRLEVVMAERNGAYWLPLEQRIELQVETVLAREERLVLRISSRFVDLSVDERTVTDTAFELTSLLSAFPRKITVASQDSVDAFGKWIQPLGVATAAGPFESMKSVGPRAARPGAPHGVRLFKVRFGVPEFRESLRFNRVEGLYTGVGAGGQLRNGDLSATFSATVGRAWAERDWRGSADISVAGARAMVGARAGRDLESTNDFLYAADHAAQLLAPLFSRDDQDYFDRQAASVYAEWPARPASARLRLEVAAVSDRPVVRSIRFGVVRSDSGFRDVRPITPGQFATLTATSSWHPDVLAEYLRPGVGLSARAQVATGDLRYQRAEVRLGYRRISTHGVALSARLDAGMLFSRSTPPLQQIFELGGPSQLPGFGYKIAAGDRAALGKLEISVPLVFSPTLRRLPPAFRPRLAADVHSGVVSTSSESVAAAVDALEHRVPGCGVSVACRARTSHYASAQVGFRFLQGALFIGATRRISERDGWRFASGVRVY